MEVGFVAQALQLIHGPHNPVLFHPNTKAALQALAKAGHLLPLEAQSLIEADGLWRTIQGINRITGLSEKATTPPASIIEPLLRATGTPTLDALHQRIDETARKAHAIFTAHIVKGP